jgi:two-component system, cell cycle sensor histidine kinase and response regulator CckA
MPSSQNVLVVDDDPSIRIIARTVLGKSGYQVLEAADGDEAMQHFQAVGADLRMVLLDCVMPGKDGRQVFAELSAAGLTAPVVLCTGHEFDPADFTTPSGQRPRSLLKKPYDFGTLLATVQAA